MPGCTCNRLSFARLLRVLLVVHLLADWLTHDMDAWPSMSVQAKGALWGQADRQASQSAFVGRSVGGEKCDNGMQATQRRESGHEAIRCGVGG